MKALAPAREPLLVSCEHGGNRIPREYRALFSRHARALASHRGYDPGALVLARAFAGAFRAPLFFSQTSRLLVDLNRSASNRNVFSGATRKLTSAARAELLERHYRPYRGAIEAAVADSIERRGRVVHLSCHSFTPQWEGAARRADIGLLFDPARTPEAALCSAWRERLLARRPGLLVRRNYPYRGVNDALTTGLRRRHPARAYLGIELEVSQKYPLGGGAEWRALRRALVETFAEALAAAAGSSAAAGAASSRAAS
jgi:predicted N-formylglutamate amidohydrolase